jgi:hypothetical protein
VNAVSAGNTGPEETGIVVVFSKSGAGGMGYQGLNVSFADGSHHQQSWDTDGEAELWSRRRHHVVFSIDGTDLFYSVGTVHCCHWDLARFLLALIVKLGRHLHTS